MHMPLVHNYYVHHVAVPSRAHVPHAYPFPSPIPPPPQCAVSTFISRVAEVVTSPEVVVVSGRLCVVVCCCAQVRGCTGGGGRVSAGGDTHTRQHHVWSGT